VTGYSTTWEVGTVGRDGLVTGYSTSGPGHAAEPSAPPRVLMTGRGTTSA